MKMAGVDGCDFWEEEHNRGSVVELKKKAEELKGVTENLKVRKRLFSLINDLPTVFEVVTERKPINKPSVDIGSKSRISTKERGILKEADMEKKLHHPQNQAAAVSSFRGGNSQRRSGNGTKENEICSVQSNGSNNNPERNDKEPSKEVQKAGAKLSRTARLQTIREQACRTPQRRFNSVQKNPNHTTFSQNDINNNENKKPEDCIRKLQGQFVKPQGKLMNSLKPRANGLCIIKEISKAKSAGKPYQGGFASSTKSTTSAAFTSSSRGPTCHTFSVSKYQGCAKAIV